MLWVASLWKRLRWRIGFIFTPASLKREFHRVFIFLLNRYAVNMQGMPKKKK